VPVGFAAALKASSVKKKSIFFMDDRFDLLPTNKRKKS
jgi:hypothetical protein